MKAVIFAALVFMAFDASATTTLLTGSIAVVNPQGSWKAPQTINYNAIYGTALACENAKTAAINAPLDVYPVSSTNIFGAFYKVVMLSCDAKSTAE